MSAPLASAVIVTYNQEKYIAQTIECALAQKVDFDYEIVIGEDCSTDRTREICLRYQEKYPDIIRVVTSDKNVGLLDNWYRSVKAAKGKYIAGCGGDDYWHRSDKIQKQVQFLEENMDYGLVHSDYDSYIENKGITIKNCFSVKKFKHENASEKPLEFLMTRKAPILAVTVMIRKTLFDQYFDIALNKREGFMMEDTPLYIEIAANSKIHFIPESFATYRKLEESVTNSRNKKKFLKFWISASKMNLYYCFKYNLPSYVIEMHKKNWRHNSLKLAFIEKNIDLAQDVKAKDPNFLLKDWFWYLGAKYTLIRPIVLLAKILLKRNL
jgi:glycosyltransferase involved in cell wall biosynthesis